MLNPETAKTRLAEFAAPKEESATQQLARIKALATPAMRAAGFGAIGRGPDGEHYGATHKGAEANKLSQAARDAAKIALDEGLTAAERRGVFAAFLPGFARGLEAMWTDTRGLYQNGYSRRAFRAPGRPDLTRDSRYTALWFLLNQLEIYADQDCVWLATWAAYFTAYRGAQHIGTLLACAIDAGGAEGDAVFDTLIASGNGEHEIGAMGRHVTGALLSASRPDGWAWVERLLLAAQRQEGLRQAVLEAIDEAHPQAFRRMLGIIRSENLLRFSSVVRAADVWFGFGWTAPTDKQAVAVLDLVATFLDDGDAARAALIPNGDADGQTVYLALWSLAFDDAPAALAPAALLLHDNAPERRFAAAHFLAETQLPEGRAALIVALDDPELAVSARAAALQQVTVPAPGDAPALFDAYVRNLPRFPKPERQLGPVVWPWMFVQASREKIANALVTARGTRPPSDLMPYLREMDGFGRAGVARLFADPAISPPSAESRDALLRLMSDASSYVRETAMKGLNLHSPNDPAVATGLEALLTRKSGDTRRALIGMLLKQSDANALASAGRLLDARPSSPQRAAGLDLLTQMVRAERSAPLARECAAMYARDNPAVGESESALLEELTREDAGAAPTLDDALGLMDPANLTPAVRPDLPALPAAAPPTGFLGRVAALVTGVSKSDVARPALPPLASEASLRLIHAVDEWVEQHRESPIKIKTWQNDGSEILLGSVGYYFPTPNAKLPISAERERLPLFELWEAWWKDRPADLRDSDGLEAIRANTAIRAYASRFSLTSEQKSAAATLFAPLDVKKLRHERVTAALLTWSARLFPADGAATIELQLRGAQTTLARMPAAAFVAEAEPAQADDRQKPPIDWRYSTAFSSWLVEAQEGYALAEVEASPWSAEQVTRLWNLLAWRDRPFPGMRRYRPTFDMTLAARRAGAATDDDLYDMLLGPRERDRQNFYGSGARLFKDLNALSTRREPAAFATTPGLRPIVARCRERVIEVELARGDTPTPATPAALALRGAGGVETLVRVLQTLGKGSLARGASSGEVNRASVFSYLLRATFPGPDDTPLAFSERVRGAKIAEARLIEVALYAPQWARHVEAAVGWTAFAEGVWWLHAHTKDSQWSVEKETRDAWAAEIADKTPLTADDLVEGGVDVAWFGRVHAALGAERWKGLDAAAKFASSSGGHKRAQLFADAMLGREDRATVVRRITEKRHGDAVRAFGLLPLPAGDSERQAEALARYQIIQEFRRTSRQFGAQRQESEKKAARIGLENLARTAGYADPARLEWAMEAHAVADLRGGPLRAESGEVAVQLSINALGAPVLAFTKKGKPVKTLPTATKKVPEIAGLIDRRVEIERQGKRMRSSLEDAMCRGDVFEAAELARLYEHPVLQPFLRGLLFLTEGAEDAKTPRFGYLATDGAALENIDGESQSLAADARVRIAHSHDLFQTGVWERFQHDCFTRERVQPFKQVFRELYLLTDNEQEEGGRVSRRYAGHQVNPAQAVALLGKRGWVNKPDEGVAQRSFHAEGLSAAVDFVGTTFSPLDVEGLTVEHVSFTRRGEWKPIPLADVPPRVFSEAMRDLDLVVSVAHQGGVDPEASASTVEMRATLVRETARLLHLDNIRLQRMHVLIDGALGTYSVHLGSAIVHRQPGGFLCIVPVHAQHRGRLFLPFADDDPRTAEVVSKVLLLAKDSEIKDPTILEQILATR